MGMKLALAGLAASVAAVGCAAPDGPGDRDASNPNAGLFRDFLDGKFDAAGHPLNARVTEAETLCSNAGSRAGDAIRLSRACTGAIEGSEQHGAMIASLHLRVTGASASGTLVSAQLYGAGGQMLAATSLTTQQRRGTAWVDLPLGWQSSGDDVTVRVVPSPGAAIELDYIEVFPERFGLVASPGSGVYADTDKLVFELPKARKLDELRIDGVDLTERLSQLLAQGKATRTTTEFRTLFEVSLGDLAPTRDDSAELELRAGFLAARAQLRRQPTACHYEGDPYGVKVLVTGFQAFPADGWHDNVSDIAVWSLDPAHLRGARVMRVTMPVEYDRAAAQVTDIIARCAPDAVISFGQGGSEIALEQVAYNLQDTGEVAGGVPDNRGIIRAATPIDPSALAERDTLLPLEQIHDALVDIGEAPAYSRDPGRYICNNVMFVNIGEMLARSGVGGFIHLPYTTAFTEDVKARYGNVVLAAVQATADALR